MSDSDKPVNSAETEPETLPGPENETARSLEAEDQASDRTAGRTMTVAAILVSALLMVGKVAGYAKEMLLSNYFGKGARTDAFKMAYNGVIYTIYTKVEKLMRPTYLPEFVKRRREAGEAEGWRVTGVVTTLQFLVLAVLVAVCVIWAKPILLLLGKRLAEDPEALRMGVVMLRIMAPALLLFSLSVMPELTLHAYKRFTLPAVAEASFRTGLLLVMVALLALVWNPQDPTAIYTVAIGVLVGGCLRFVVQVPGLRGKLRLFRPSLDITGTPSVRTILALMPPVVVGLLFSAARYWADIIFSGRVGLGVYTCLDYARKIPDMTLQVLPLAVSFVVYPFLSEWWTRGERDKMADALVSTTRALAFVFVPVSVGLMALSKPVIDLVYKQGLFGEEGAIWSSIALFCYAPGLFFFSLDASINHWYFAAKDTRTPNYVGAACAVLHIVFSYVGLYRLGGINRPEVGIAVVALALTVSKTIKIIILYGMVRKYIGRVDRSKVLIFAGKLLLCTALMAVLMWQLHALTGPRIAEFGPFVGHGKIQAMANLGLGFAAGGALFLVVALVLRIEELRLVLDHLTTRIRQRLRRGKGAD